MLLLFYGIGIELMHMLGKHTITESYPRFCLTLQLRPNVTRLSWLTSNLVCFHLLPQPPQCLGLQPWARRPICLIVFFCFETVSQSLGWLWTHYLFEDASEPLVLSLHFLTAGMVVIDFFFWFFKCDWSSQMWEPVMAWAAHSYSPSTWEAKIGRLLLNLRPAWAT